VFSEFIVNITLPGPPAKAREQLSVPLRKEKFWFYK